jgi:cysteine-rich repeat protein
MFRRFTFVPALVVFAFGCTSADFSSAPPDEDGSVDDASLGDATRDDTLHPGDSAIDDSDATLDSAIPDDGRDGSAPDADALPPVDADAAPTCVGKPDGTPCDSSDGKKRICVAEGCTLSKCGDKIVDPTSGEECDDGNEVSKDGCEPVTCKFSCHTVADCPSTTCITGRACDVTHKCTDGTIQPKTTGCVTAAGTGGYCNAGTCASASCGNHTVEPGEECDDGDTDPTNGCKNDCTFTCKGASDCGDGNACNGIESCNTTSHTCAPGTPPTCDDSNACTANSCAPGAGCTNPFIDGDGDGYAPAARGTCGGAYAGKDGDCNDGNSAVHPGVTEICNGVDDNCAGGIDEGIPLATCGVGECANTGSTCLPTSCTPKPATAEICDGKDNDCNGVNDNGVPLATCGVGECANTGTTCFAASCVPKPATSEVCDGKDNDCNGKNDDIAPTSCFTGPGTAGKGICKAGTNACAATAPYSMYCAGQVVADDTLHDVIGTPGGAGQDGWDYNCNGAEDLEFPSYAACNSSCLFSPRGWLNDGTSPPIPGCGASGTLAAVCIKPSFTCYPDPAEGIVAKQRCK